MKSWHVIVLAVALVASAGVGVVAAQTAMPPDAADIITADRDGAQAIVDRDNAWLATTSTVPASTTTTTSEAPSSTSTSTTTPPSTTSTVPPTTTSTSTPASTSSVPATTSTQPLPQSTGCKFSGTVTVAFCDSFDSPAGDPATRSGDLDAQVWGVSRTNTFINLGQGQFNDWYPATLNGCGPAHAVSAPRDVQVCSGRLVEAVSDHGGQSMLAMYPKQPFDIAGGRTGTVVFDVSADAQSGHAAWPEFWWTDQPVPTPGNNVIPSQSPLARNAFGFVVSSQCADGKIGVDSMWAVRSYTASDLDFTGSSCVTKGSVAGGLNHFEVRIAQARVEVWGTDAGSTSLKLMAVAANANLTMTRGLVWISDVHYNGCKVDSQCDHTFAWDNVGFDGPTPYRDLSFDVPDASLTRHGWHVSTALTAVHTVPVYRLQPPTAALVTFNFVSNSWPPPVAVPSFRLNGGAWHDTAWPFTDTDADGWRTIGVSVPVAEVVDGSNLVEFRTAAGDQVVSNINVILVAGAPVP